MISASSVGRDHIGQWLVGSSTHVMFRTSCEPQDEVVAGLDRVLVLVRRERRADDGARNVQAGVVGELDGLPEDVAGLRDGALAERRELLVGQPVEVLIGRQLLRAKGVAFRRR